MNIHTVNKTNNNCLIHACSKNQNIDIIKYLIEECKMDTSCVNSFGNDCLMLAMVNNQNIEIIKYLIMNTKCPLILNPEIELTEYEILLPACTNDYNRLNEFIKQGIKIFGTARIHEIITDINPFMFNSRLQKKLSKDPHKEPWDKFVKHVGEIDHFNEAFIKCFSCCKMNHMGENTLYIEKQNFTNIDFTHQSEILFKHNNINYYGFKDMVYPCIHLLKDMAHSPESYNFDSPVEFTGPGSKNMINLYLKSCYENTFNVDDIQVCDFIDFLIFIDKYPTDILSIDLMEISLIYYMRKYDIRPNDQIMSICNKYQLKELFLHLAICTKKQKQENSSIF